MEISKRAVPEGNITGVYSNTIQERGVPSQCAGQE